MGCAGRGGEIVCVVWPHGRGERSERWGGEGERSERREGVGERSELPAGGLAVGAEGSVNSELI